MNPFSLLPRNLTVRARITVWNVAVMAFVLAILGIALRVTVRAYLITSIDREVTGRYERGRDFWQREDHAPFTRDGRRRGGRGEREGGERNGGERANRPPNPAEPREEAGRGGGATTPAPSPSPPQARFRLLALDGEPYFYGSEQRVLDRVGFERAVRGEVFANTVEVDGEPLRVIYGPLRNRQGTILAVAQHPFVLTDIRRGVGAVTLILVVLIPLALVAAGLGGAFLTERALRPVRAITDAAGAIEADNLSGRLPVHGNDEFARLATTFNAMLERLEAAFNRQRRFTADASHELRTPLSVIKASTSLALESPRSADEYRAILETIDPAADRMERIVRDLLFLARSDGRNLPVERHPILLRHLIEDAVREIRPYGAEGPSVVIDTPDRDLMVEGDPHHLNRLLVNLIENADRHTPAAGSITVRAVADGADGIEISVTDTGEGIPSEHLPHVFDQFYRVDPARSREHGGAGLGLAICKAIVEAHGGATQIASRVGEGTRVTVRVPGRVQAPNAVAA